jgi:hypothetical protein
LNISGIGKFIFPSHLKSGNGGVCVCAWRVGKLKAGLAIRALEWLEGVLRLFYRACIIFAQRSGAAGLMLGVLWRALSRSFFRDFSDSRAAFED